MVFNLSVEELEIISKNSLMITCKKITLNLFSENGVCNFRTFWGHFGVIAQKKEW